MPRDRGSKWLNNNNRQSDELLWGGPEDDFSVGQVGVGRKPAQAKPRKKDALVERGLGDKSGILNGLWPGAVNKVRCCPRAVLSLRSDIQQVICVVVLMQGG